MGKLLALLILSVALLALSGCTQNEPSGKAAGGFYNIQEYAPPPTDPPGGDDRWTVIRAPENCTMKYFDGEETGYRYCSSKGYKKCYTGGVITYRYSMENKDASCGGKIQAVDTTTTVYSCYFTLPRTYNECLTRSTTYAEPALGDEQVLSRPFAVCCGSN